jgi:lipoprotein-anchoring transpeptidase ErfK/SrfK
LRAGAVGPDVARLEQRLAELGFWLRPPDETFDAATTHAVVAFQKLSGLKPDGTVGPDTAAALAVATRPVPRTGEGHVLEVDLTHQVLIVADAGSAVAVLDVSTGRVAGTTPIGRFTVTRQVDGYDHSPLGVLYRPKYFVRGVAIHGFPSVPPYPASHGCVRTTNAAMDWLWSSGAAPIGTPVLVYR